MKLKFLSLPAAVLIAFQASAAYDVNYPADQTIDTSSRHLDAVGVNGSSAAVGQQTDKLLYHDLTASAHFSAKAGDVLSPSLSWTGTWMHGYAYIDVDNDGSFDPATEMFSFSNFNGVNTHGEEVGGDVGVALHPFVLPIETPAGEHRMRFVVDWNWNDPGGRTDSNNIVKNNGAIVDVTLQVEAADPIAEPYALNYPKEACSTHETRHTGHITFSQELLGELSWEVCQGNKCPVYYGGLLEPGYEVKLQQGVPTSLQVGYVGEWMNAYVYMDLNGDGLFNAHVADGRAVPGSDLLAYSHYQGTNSLGATSAKDGNDLNIPDFVIPENIKPGTYRMRVKVDWDNIDPAGNNSENNNILKNGGTIIDLNVEVLPKELPVTTITPKAMNGLILTADNTAPTVAPSGFAQFLRVTPTLPGFHTDKVIVRHGRDIHGPSSEWTDTELEINSQNGVWLPEEVVEGSEIEVYALFEELDDSEWTKVWGDEFNDGALDPQKWSYQPRYNATWNRLVAKTDEGRELVNRFENGTYSSYAIATPEELAQGEDNVQMITGAIYSQNKMHMTYGKVEARLRTTMHTGNFPAFWMMPARSPYGWPKDGEIDVFEQVNTNMESVHTVHSGWTGYKDYCGWGSTPPKQLSEPNSTTFAINPEQWNVYALEWDEDALRFYANGQLAYTYENKHYSEPSPSVYTEEICWPFSHDFYVILNQSVGVQGGWAKAPDPNFTYNTQFDYVRVYKKKSEVDDKFYSKVAHNGDDPNFYKPGDVDTSIAKVEAPATAPAIYFDLNGRRVGAASLLPGLYIKKQGDSVSKILVK